MEIFARKSKDLSAAVQAPLFFISLALISIFISTVFTPTSSSQAIAARASKNKYSVSLKMAQASRLVGDEILWVTPSGLRLENPRSHIVFVAKAPDWIVYKFSLETKKYVSFSTASVVNRFTGARALFGGTVLLAASCNKSGTEKVFGYNADSFVADAAFQKKSLEMYSSGMVRNSFPKTFIYRTFPADMFPPQEAHILSILRGLPDVHGVPIDLMCDPFDKHKYKYLSALYVQPAVVPASALELPAGFRKVSDEMDITYDDSTQKDMFNFIEEHDKRKK